MSVQIADDDASGHIEKEAGIDDSGNMDHLFMDLFWIGRRHIKDDIVDEIAVFGDEEAAFLI